MSDDRLAVLATFSHELPAGMLVAALKDHGVDARAVGALTAGFRAEAPGVIKVMVREADLDDATRVLETICDEIDNDPIDWSQVDVGDPET